MDLKILVCLISAIGHISAQNVTLMEKSIEILVRQLQMQQLQYEERVRSDGDSGLKMVRQITLGTNPYLRTTQTGWAMASIHDHSNNIRTCGMGEVVAVLNGVEFRTRHNDFRLFMPHRTSNKYHAVEEIPFPDVPPAVTGTVQQQIAEMKKWFKAFKDQDHSVRDYRPYFKSVLCYLEGAWTNTGNKIEEPFASDRHFVDAKSWLELFQKIDFTSYKGAKDNAENLAFLPSKLHKLDSNKLPQFSQFNYRILCNPTKTLIPTNRLVLIDDLASRIGLNLNMTEYAATRRARYRIKEMDSNDPPTDTVYSTGLLDQLMMEIPGLDNHVGNITDSTFGDVVLSANGNPLNAAFYHRAYKLGDKGAMGIELNYRGFADQNLFVAYNTRNETTPSSYSACDDDGVCTSEVAKASFAIPLEMIYLTPIYKWNPYNIPYRGDEGTPGAEVVAAPPRNGQPTKELAFNGTQSDLFARTPYEFFTGGEVAPDPADTTTLVVSVLDSNDNVRNVSASGTRIFTPPIGNAGSIRLRYPIAPIHAEGSVNRKELEALKKTVSYIETYLFAPDPEDTGE